MDIFDLSAKITLDSSEFEKGVNQAGGAMDGLSAKAVALGNAIYDIGQKAVSAFGTLAKSALDATGQLEQGIGGSEAVFEDYASTIQDKAAGAFETMGLSANDFIATANKMGSLFKGSGFDIAEATDLTTEAMQRAADVASIMGIDTTWAMESIAGAAKGNFTMMDNLGVAINETTLNAYALEQGLDKTTRQMTNQEKVGLALQMFLEKTSYAAGNYAKENETLSGSMSTLSAAWNNFLSGAGGADELFVSLQNTLSVLGENVGEIIPRLADGFGQLFEKFTGIDLSGVRESFSSLAQTFSDLSTAFQEGGISGVVDELVQKFESLTGIDLSGLVEGIKGFFDAFQGIDTGEIKGIADNVGAIIDKLNVPSLGDIITAIADGLGTVFEVLGGAVGLGLDFVAGIISQLRQDFDVWAPGIAAVATAIGVFVAGLEAMKIIESIKNSVGLFADAFNKLNTIMSQNPILLVVSLLAALAAAFVTAYQTNDEFRAKVDEAWTKIKELAGELGDKIKTVFTEDIPNAVSSAVAAIKNKASEFVQAGKDLISGFINGIKEKINGVKDAVGEAADTAVSWVKDKLGIRSPSRVFMQIGKYAMEGFAIGFEDGYSNYSGQISGIVQNLISDAEKSVKSIGAVYTGDLSSVFGEDFASHVVSSVDYRDSAVGKSSAASINAAMASSGGSVGTQTINLVVDGRTLANVVFDPLSGIAKQKGVAIGA